MYTETVLLESRSLRSGVSHRTEILDKVKALALSADGVHATTWDVAEYFEVSESVVNNLLDRHRGELKENGLRILRGSELREYQNLTMRLSSANANSYPQRRSQLAVWTRRTVLNAAMLLRDSDIARRVRVYLLDAEESHRSPHGHSASVLDDHEQRLRRVERATEDLGSVLHELGPVIGRMSDRLERVDRRLEEIDRRLVGTDRVVGAMSLRLCDMGEDLRTVRDDLDDVRRDVRREAVRRARRRH